jgi:hypothetical protein
MGLFNCKGCNKKSHLLISSVPLITVFRPSGQNMPLKGSYFTIVGLKYHVERGSRSKGYSILYHDAGRKNFPHADQKKKTRPGPSTTWYS